MSVLLALAVCFLAYSNGANDNFKGVASLFGSATTSYRTAISWATICTFAGAAAAIFFAHTLLTKFSGKGLVPDAVVASEYFLFAVAVGAGATVILATVTGFPISTTHPLTGAMAGSGWVAVGPQVNLGALLYLIFDWGYRRLGITPQYRIRARAADSTLLQSDAAGPPLGINFRGRLIRHTF